MCRACVRSLFSRFRFLLSLFLLSPICLAQFAASDNFNRADGSVGLGWSTWGNEAQIDGNQLETFGGSNIAGGIARNLNVSFPLSFSFNFSTDDPTDGGWQIGFNAANAGQVVDVGTAPEFGLFQYRGSGSLCIAFQTSSGLILKCGHSVSGQRDYTATALISGVVNADLSTKITFEYNDGLLPKTVTVRTSAPVGALSIPQGSICVLGNSNLSTGPHFFDNFQLKLM